MIQNRDSGITPAKLLIDPYARAIEGRINMVESMFDYTFEHRLQGQCITRKDELDSGNRCK
jgi:hypothetical protein